MQKEISDFTMAAKHIDTYLTPRMRAANQITLVGQRVEKWGVVMARSCTRTSKIRPWREKHALMYK